jgi:hypothetical protein
MTTETATRQDGLHVLIKVQPARSGAMTARKSDQNKDSQKRNQGQLCVWMRLMVCLAYDLSLRDQTVLQADPQLGLIHCIADFHNRSNKIPFHWRLGVWDAAITNHYLTAVRFHLW